MSFCWTVDFQPAFSETLGENCLIHTFLLLLICDMESQELVIMANQDSSEVVKASIAGPGTNQHTRKTSKALFETKDCHFSVVLCASPLLCLYYSPLCSSLSLAPLCVGVFLRSTLPYGAPPFVIAWTPHSLDRGLIFITGSQVLHDESCLLPLLMSLSTVKWCICSLAPWIQTQHTYYSRSYFSLCDDDWTQLWFT